MKSAKEMREIATAASLERYHKEVEEIKSFIEQVVQPILKSAASEERYYAHIDIPEHIQYNLMAEYIKKFGYTVIPSNNGYKCTIKW